MWLRCSPRGKGAACRRTGRWPGSTPPGVTRQVTRCGCWCGWPTKAPGSRGGGRRGRGGGRAGGAPAPRGAARVVRLAVAAVGHAVTVAITVIAVGDAIAIAVPVVAVGNAVTVTVPAAPLHFPAAIALHPLGLPVLVAAARLYPVALHPAVAVAAPFPMALFPHLATAWARHGFVPWWWGRGNHLVGLRGLVPTLWLVGLNDDGALNGRVCRYEGQQCHQGDGGCGQCLAGHGGLRGDSWRNRSLHGRGLVRGAT